MKKTQSLESEFFHQATMRICSQLNIEIGMSECIKYIRQYIPINVMYLELIQAELGVIKLIAKATAEKGEKIDLVMQIPPDITTQISKQETSFKHQPEVMVVNQPELDPTTPALLELCGEPYSSVMGLPLVIENKPLGGVVVLAEGKNRYTEEHAALFSLLKEPFFIALSNTLEHQEVITLKDRLADDNRYLFDEMFHNKGENIIGRDFGLKPVMAMVRQVAMHDSPVLLTGETGVGKDVIANAIHFSSRRSKGPMIAVNCGAIPDTLIDSELFGHEKGAFTGALTQKRGRFERADGGTIFLDEIGELPPPAQVRLLRVLQNREFERVGGNKPIKVDIRIIAATNKNLEEMIREGQFREDLWFRLNVFPIQIPPLRERKSDIPALVHFFLENKTTELKLRDVPDLAPSAMSDLKAYDWPGNVRELENVVERELILRPDGPLTFSTIRRSPQSQPFFSHLNDEKAIPSFDDLARDYFNKVLTITNGKINGPKGAAELTGLSPNTLRNKMKKLKLPFGRNRMA